MTLPEWYADQYLRAVGLAHVEGGRLFNACISQFPNPSKIEGITITGRARMEKFIELKMRNPLGHSGYNVVAIGATVGGSQAHFALIYWPVGTRLSDAATERDIPAFITVSPTFTSRDGEYRRRMLPLSLFMANYDEHAKELAVFEDTVLQLQSAGLLTFTVSAFGEEPGSDIERVIDEGRFAILTFSIALMLDLWDNKKSLIAIHILPDYAQLITAVAELKPQLLTTSRDMPYRVRSPFVRGVTDRYAVATGIKLIPMYTREVNQPFDMNLSAWRELEVAKAVGDLVVGYVSPAFAIFNQWTYVERAGPLLFENPAMHERYQRSSQMAGSIDELRKSRCRLSLDCAAGDNAAALDADLRTYHTEELSAQLYESLEYAQSHLLVSTAAMVHSVEDVGYTLQSWPVHIRREVSVPPSHLSVFADLDSFARLMFDYVYGAHCLHERLGVVHGDLHANNLTVYWWGRAETGARIVGVAPAGAPSEYTPAYRDPIMLYVAGPRGEADSYVFPAAGISGCIIDYSRAILGPAFRPRLEAGRTPQFATNFYRDQVNRVMRLLHRYAPEYVAANQDAIKGAAFADFGSVFRALCSVDFIAIGMSAALALEGAAVTDADERRRCPVAPGAAELARQIERAGRTALIGALHEIVERAKVKVGGGCLFDCADECDGAECDCAQVRSSFPALTAAVSADTPPAAVGGDADAPPATGGGAADTGKMSPIIESVFGNYQFGKWAARAGARAQKAELVDAYNYNNSIADLSSSEYSRWPRWARIDEIEKHLGDLKLADVIAGGTEKFIATLTGRDLSFEALAAQARADALRADGRPVAAASSWLDE